MPTKRKEGISVEKMVASAYRANSSTNRMFGYSTSYLFASYLPTCNTVIWQNGMFTVQQLTKASARGSLPDKCCGCSEATWSCRRPAKVPPPLPSPATVAAIPVRNLFWMVKMISCTPWPCSQRTQVWRSTSGGRRDRWWSPCCSRCRSWLACWTAPCGCCTPWSTRGRRQTRASWSTMRKAIYWMLSNKPDLNHFVDEYVRLPEPLVLFRALQQRIRSVAEARESRERRRVKGKGGSFVVGAQSQVLPVSPASWLKVRPPKNCIGYLRLTSREIIIFESSTCTMLLLMLIDLMLMMILVLMLFLIILKSPTLMMLRTFSCP